MARRRTSVIQVMVTGDASDLNRATQSGSKGMSVLGAAAVTAAKLVTSSLTAIAGFSIREFAKFDEAMVKSTAIMGDLSNAMRDDMAQAAREVAKSTTFSASEAADAFFFLASAGLDAEQSIAALPQVARFAQAGAFDLARATDLLTDAQSALGLTSDDTAENLENLSRVSDVLVKANTLANASVDEFSSALTERAGAAMRELGVEIETGVAVLSVFADQGIKGSKAGTMLNTTLEGLTRTAREQSEAYDALGVSVFDSEGEMRNMASIVGDLEGALGGMSTEARLAALASLGLTRQARDGVIQLLGNADAIREYEEALRDAGGTTDEVAQRQLQSFNAQLALLRSGFADVGITIGAALADPLSRFVTWFREQLPAIEAFVERAIPQIEAFVDRAVAKFGEFRQFFNDNLREPLENFKTTLIGFGEIGREEFDTLFQRFRNFGQEFKAAIDENDPEAAGELLGELIAETFRQAFARAEIIGDAIKDWAGSEDWGEIGAAIGVLAVDFVRGFVRGMFSQPDVAQGEAEAGGRTITRILSENFVSAIIGAAILARLPIVGGLFRILFAAVALPFKLIGLAFGVTTAPAFGLAILKGLLAVFKFLGGALAIGVGKFILFPLINAVNTMFALLGFATTAQGMMMAERIRTFFRGTFVGRIGAAITNAFNAIRALGIRTIIRTVALKLAAFVGAIVGWPAVLVAAIVGAITLFIIRFRNWFNTQDTEFENIGSAIVEFIWQGLQKLWSWFDDNVIGFFRERFSGLGGWFSNQWNTFKGWGSGIIDGMLSGIRSKASELRDSLVGAARNAWNATKNFLGIRSPSKLFEGIGVNMMEGLSRGIDESAGVVQAAVGVNSAMAANEARRFAEIAAQQRASASGARPTQNIEINVQGGLSPAEEIAREIEKALGDSERRTGSSFIEYAPGLFAAV